MLNPVAFGCSLAVLYVLFGVLALVSPRAFQLLFNSQFFGADRGRAAPEGDSFRRVSRDVRHRGRHVMGHGIRVGLAVQSHREDVLIANQSNAGRGRAGRTWPSPRLCRRQSSRSAVGETDAAGGGV